MVLWRRDLHNNIDDSGHGSNLCVCLSVCLSQQHAYLCLLGLLLLTQWITLHVVIAFI